MGDEARSVGAKAQNSEDREYGLLFAQRVSIKPPLRKTLRYRMRPRSARVIGPGKRRLTALQAGNAVTFAAVIAINSLAGGTKLLGGRNTADVSAAYPTLVTPAGFTFAIWGVIYALLAIFVVFQLLPKHRQDPFNGRVDYLFILSGIFNIAW